MPLRRSTLALLAAVIAAAGPVGSAGADVPPPAPGAATPAGEAPSATGDAPAPELVPGRSVLLMVADGTRGGLEDALHLELAPRGVAVLGVDPPGGDTPLERAANAQRAARFAGAVAAVWVERAVTGGGAMLRVVPADAETPRQTPLPGPVAALDARTFALVAESLLDELVAPPAAPVRVRVEVQVDAPGQEVTVTTLHPAPGTTEAEVAIAPPAAGGAPEPAAPPPTDPAPVPPPAPDLGLAPAAGAALEDTGAPDAAHPVVGFGADLVPMVGTSMFHRGREIRRLSLNLGGGLSHGVDGVGLAGAFQLAPGFIDGFALSGGFNYAGRVHGVVAAGAANVVGGPVDGGQLAGAFNLAGGRLDGPQIAAGVNIAAGGFRGAQVAGLMNHAYAASAGAQVAAGVNFSLGGLSGAQVAGALNVAAGDVRGSQIAGGVNVATGQVDGLQLGVVNVSRKAGFALGLVNVFWGGRFHVEASADSSGFFHGRVKNGGDHFHYVYSVGGNPFDETVSAFGAGLGGHAVLGERLFLDVEGLGHVLVGGDEEAIRLDDARGGARGLYTARVLLGFRIAPRLALLGGLSYDVYVARADHVDDGSGYGRFGDTLFSGDAPGARIVRGWPSVTLGVQVF